MKKLCLLSLLSFLFLSCGLKPYQPAYNYIQTKREHVKLDSLGNGRVLIYNGADILHTLDNTERLNIWIKKKPLGQLWGYEYVIINLDAGEYTFDLQHKDLVNMRSSHKVIINDTVKIIRVEPTMFSNKITITNKLPKKFSELYRLAKNRVKK